MTLSICTTLYQRGAHFRKLYQSLAPALLAGAELVVCDYHSSDLRLQDFPGIRVVEEELPFNLSRARNLAAAQAQHQTLCFLDADMVAPVYLFEYITATVRDGVAWFPICFNTDRTGRPTVWRVTGYGNVAITKRDLERAGGWDESCESWGWEDSRFWSACQAAGIECIRAEARGLIHQWHREDYEWKNQYRARNQANPSRCDHGA